MARHVSAARSTKGALACAGIWCGNGTAVGGGASGKWLSPEAGWPGLGGIFDVLYKLPPAAPALFGTGAGGTMPIQPQHIVTFPELPAPRHESMAHWDLGLSPPVGAGSSALRPH